MRIVADTNVVVSRYIAPRGNPARVLDRWRQGEFDLLVSEPLLREYRRVFGYARLRARHHLSDAEIERVIEDLRELAIMTAPCEPIPVVEDDPDDDKFLECAVAGGAEIIVSGDEHLLRLGNYRGIQILSPAAFLAYLDTLR